MRKWIVVLAMMLGLAAVPQEASAAAGLPGTNGKVLSLATYLAGGTPYAVVCGNFTSMGGVPTSGVAVINLNTNAVKFRGKVSGGWVDSCAVSNNTIWMGGTFSAVNGVSRSRAAALSLSDFSLRSWRPNVGGQRVYAVTTAADKVFLAASSAVRAVNMSTGSNLWVQAVFGGAPRSLLAIPGHNRLYVGGGFSGFSGGYKPMLGAMSLNTGGMDPTWNPQLRPNTSSGPYAGFDGENVLAMAYDQGRNRICTGIGGHATNALACFNAYQGPREVMHSTVGDVQAVLVADGYYFAGYHRTYRGAVAGNVEWIANAWSASGGDTTWGDGFSGSSDPEQGGPFGNDGRNGGINALARNPVTGVRLAGGAFTIPGKSLAYIG